MSQNILTNATTPPLAGSTAVGVLNLAADSLARWFCGAATPTAAAAGLADLKGFVWHDTATNTLKVRDQADSAWIVVGYFDETGKTFTAHVNPAAIYAADTGSANAYAVAPAPAWPSLAGGGPLVAFVAAHPNTGAATINVCGLGVKPIVRQDGSALLAGDILGTEISLAIWNQGAGNFQLLTQRQTPLAFIKGTVSNLQVATASAGTRATTITADAVVLLDSSGNPYLATSVSQTPSLTVSGAGGLDTGSAAASTWYSVWLIWNPATPALSALFSLSAAAPALPTGYTFKARVGWALTDASTNLKPFIQYGSRAQYINTGAGLPLMASGASGSVTTPTWTPLAWAGFAPPTASAMTLSVLSYRTILVAPNGNYGAANSVTNPPPINQGVNNGTPLTAPATLQLESSNLYWASYASGAAIFALGWDDNL